MRGHEEEERYSRTEVGRDHVKRREDRKKINNNKHAGANRPRTFIGAYLTLIPIQIHVVRTVIQRLIEDCRAAVTESERTRDMVTKQQGAATPAFLSATCTAAGSNLCVLLLPFQSHNSCTN